MTVRIIWHPSSRNHDPGPGHPESPARIDAVLAELRRPAYDSLVSWVEAAPAPRSAIERVHPASHVDRIAEIARRGGGQIDQDTTMSAGSYEAAVHAAGAALEVARSALDGTPAFAAVRPPGHHATADVAMGFCLLNNVVIAAHHALADHGAKRVLIVDWDVHHGNGTQALVEREPRIRYVSLHQWPLYPGTGREDETGVGNIFNVPRPPGLSRDRYVDDLDRAVDRAVDGWTPDLLLVSAGFDALAGDPLAGFTLEPDDYRTWLTRWKDHGAPIGALLEGGYVPVRLAAAVGEVVRTLTES